MQTVFKYILIIFFFAISALTQSVRLKGKAVPGNIIIGKAEGLRSIFLDKQNISFDNEDNFILGFDRDAKGIHYLKVKFNNGKTYLKKIKLSKREYEIQEINNMKQKYVSPPDSELVRIAIERKKIASAENTIGRNETAYYSSGFVRPVIGGRITGVFGSQRILNGEAKSPHNGVDIALPAGTEVYSTGDGIVVMTGNNYYYRGNFVIIDHGQGLYSKYFHLSKISVKEGADIKRGDKIGEVGTTGRSTGPHLHWSVQWFDRRIDPLCLLSINSENLL